MKGKLKSDFRNNYSPLVVMMATAPAAATFFSTATASREKFHLLLPLLAKVIVKEEGGKEG
jgi:hypothetical protein